MKMVHNIIQSSQLYLLDPMPFFIIFSISRKAMTPDLTPLLMEAARASMHPLSYPFSSNLVA
jgi:hypothetical protein